MIGGYFEWLTSRGDLGFWEWLKLRYIMRAVLGVVALMIISLVMSCQELSYMISGKVTEATTTTDVREERLEGGGVRQKRVMGYYYNDGEKTERRFVNVAMDAEVPEKVRVHYLPGRGISRIEGQRNWVWVGIFFGSLGAAVLGFVVLAIIGARE